MRERRLIVKRRLRSRRIRISNIIEERLVCMGRNCERNEQRGQKSERRKLILRRAIGVREVKVNQRDVLFCRAVKRGRGDDCLREMDCGIAF